MTTEAALSIFWLIVFLVFSVGAARFLFRRVALSRRRKWLLLAVIVISVTAKLILATTGENYDIGSWRIVSTIVEQGKSVYASTDRYNYGPIWATTLSGLAHIAPLVQPRDQTAFHLKIAFFLAIVDTLIGLLLAAEFSSIAAVVFLLSPLGALISGFHSQFDNFALLMALISWLLIRRGNPRLIFFIASALLMGLSLATKHIMFVFPIWLLSWNGLGRPLRRITYAAIAYALFLLTFLPWSLDPVSRDGIKKHVLAYSGGGTACGIPLLTTAARSVLPEGLISTAPPMRNLKILWLALLLGAGFVCTRRNNGDLFLQYTIAIYALTPAFGDQYIAIPLMASAVLYPVLWSWGFQASGTILLLTSPFNILGFLYSGRAPVAFGSHQWITTNEWWWILHSYMILLNQTLLIGLLVFGWLNQNRGNEIGQNRALATSAPERAATG